MVELKKEAVKDVTTLSKTAPVALAKTKEVLNQAAYFRGISLSLGA